jgi:ubiquitin-protein ligase
VRREFKEVVTSEEAQKCQIKIEVPDESNLTHLVGTVIGPPDTPFEGIILLVMLYC